MSLTARPKDHDQSRRHSLGRVEPSEVVSRDSLRQQRLAVLVERFGGPGQLSDEHFRYQLYGFALDREQLWPLLRECLVSEPDRGVVAAVLVQIFDRVAPSERRAWAAALNPAEGDRSASKDFLERRIAEHEILDQVVAQPTVASGVVGRVESMSPAFQRRVISASSSIEVLEVLAQRGVRRIRHQARLRLAELQKPSSG
jgi:hypothetical protein